MTTRTDTSPLALWVLFLAGPVIWFGHFSVVYLVAEAACAAGGLRSELFGMPLVALLTLAATTVAVVATLTFAALAHRHWRTERVQRSDWLAGDDRNPGVALAGFLLGLLFAVAILFVGVPAAFLDPC